MDNDDAPVGRILTRREALLLLSASGAALLTGSGFLHGWSVADATLPPSCVARPEQTEGPYFVDERLNRSDIRSDPPAGTPKPARHCAYQSLVRSQKWTPIQACTHTVTSAIACKTPNQGTITHCTIRTVL